MINSISVLHFLNYFSVTLFMVLVFIWIYIKTSHYDDVNEIRKGNLAPAISLVGVIFGFLFPILACSFYSVNVVDFISWSAVSCILQIIVYKFVYIFISEKDIHNNIALALFHASLAVATGLINAFSLIPV
jgi:putative membrane protein